MSKKEFKKYINNYSEFSGAEHEHGPHWILKDENKEYIVHVADSYKNISGSYDTVVDKVIKEDWDGGYIAVSSAVRVPIEVIEEAETKGVGIMRFGENIGGTKIERLPDSRTGLIYKNLPESIKDIVPYIPENKNIIEEVGKVVRETQAKMKVQEFPSEVIVFIIMGGILSASLWGIIEHYLLFYLPIVKINIYWGVLLIVGLILFIYYIFINKKSKK